MRVVDEKLLDEFRSRQWCEWCKKLVPSCEPHHINTRGMGGGGRLDVRINLVGLCPRCHRDHHDGHRPLTIDLKALIAARECRLADDIEAEIAALRKRRKK